MTGLSGFGYAQARLQARYGQRANPDVWLRLYNIHDFSSYLQAAQQTSLRSWLLGISSSHNSHEIELILRQKYRRHVDQVAGWVPKAWQTPVQWTKRLPDLPVIQYLLANSPPLDWMKSDPEISRFLNDDPTELRKTMQSTDCACLVNAWQQGEPVVTGWLSHWNRTRPRIKAYEDGLRQTEQLLQTYLSQTELTGVPLAEDHGVTDDKLGRLFRRYAFQPAGVCAYLAAVALDIHRLRGDLLRRVIFQEREEHQAGYTL